MRMAREAGQDLVEVAPTARPPVCRIMDYGKWRYQQQKKEDKSRASSRAGRLKMLNVDTIRIGDHDLEIKINRARDFLKEGNKVQFTLRFKGREMAHIDLGYKLFDRVRTELWGCSKVERPAKMEGRRMTMVLQPDHKNPAAKPPEPNAPRAGSGLNIPPRPAVAAGATVGQGNAGSAAPSPATRPAVSPVSRPAPAGAPSSAPRPAPTPVTR